MSYMWRKSSRYSQVPFNLDGDIDQEKSQSSWITESLRRQILKLSPEALLGVVLSTILFTGIVGFGVGAVVFREHKRLDSPRDTVPQGLRLACFALNSCSSIVDLTHTL